MAKTYIHINKHKLAANRKHKQKEPVITVKTYRYNRYGFAVKILDKDGNEAARVVYTPDKPLSCGAECYVVTENETQIITEYEDAIRLGDDSKGKKRQRPLLGCKRNGCKSRKPNTVGANCTG